MQIGLESLCAGRRSILDDGACFGLLMNRASVDRQLRPAHEVLAESHPRQLKALFTPQHGLYGDVQANMVETPHARLLEYDVPIFSLYCETRQPTAAMLSGLDCFVIDLQDVGTRVYTFVWTMLKCMEACAASQIPVIVLDRPNPLGGSLVEGPLLQPGFRSFVGGASIPMRHGLTVGELALLLNDELQLSVELDVVALEGWSRDQTFPLLKRHWIPPSPNLPRYESAVVYPGQVLLEGTNLSEGRGTTTPFEVFGAPFIEPRVLCDAFAGVELPGVRFLPIRFTPMFDKWQGRSCGGITLMVTDRDVFRPFRTTVALLMAVASTWPKEFTWLDPPYEYEMSKPPIDIISGGTLLRERINHARWPNAADLNALTQCDEEAWSKRTLPFLKY